MDLSRLSQIRNAPTRSISPENFTGAKNAGALSVDGPAAERAKDLGVGWKISPFVNIAAGETFTLAEIEESGHIQHIWMTPTGK